MAAYRRAKLFAAYLGLWILGQGVAHALTCKDSGAERESACIDKRVGFGVYGAMQGQGAGANFGGYLSADLGFWGERLIAQIPMRLGVSGAASGAARGNFGMLAFTQPSIGLNLASAQNPIAIQLIAPLESTQIGSLTTTLFSLGVALSARIGLGEILSLESSAQYSYVVTGMYSAPRASLGDFGGAHQGFDQVADRAYSNLAHTRFSGGHRAQASLGIYTNTRTEYFARVLCAVYALEPTSIAGHYQNPSSLFVALEAGVGF